MSAAITFFACEARTTPGPTGSWWRGCSTRHGAIRSTTHRAFAATINDQSERLLTIRGLMSLDFAPEPVPLDEVAPAAEIVEALCDRSDELWLDQPRGAHHPRDCDVASAANPIPARVARRPSGSGRLKR